MLRWITRMESQGGPKAFSAAARNLPGRLLRTLLRKRYMHLTRSFIYHQSRSCVGSWRAKKKIMTERCDDMMLAERFLNPQCLPRFDRLGQYLHDSGATCPGARRQSSLAKREAQKTNQRRLLSLLSLRLYTPLVHAPLVRPDWGRLHRVDKETASLTDTRWTNRASAPLKSKG